MPTAATAWPAAPAAQRSPIRCWAWPFGFVAGCLGGAYNTSGPPVVVYADAQRWPPERLRATLQGYFVCSSTLIAAGHALAGLWTTDVLTLYTLALAPVAAGIALGTALARRIDTAGFERLLLVAIVVLGVVLLVA